MFLFSYSVVVSFVPAQTMTPCRWEPRFCSSAACRCTFHV